MGLCKEVNKDRKIEFLGWDYETKTLKINYMEVELTKLDIDYLINFLRYLKGKK